MCIRDRTYAWYAHDARGLVPGSDRQRTAENLPSADCRAAIWLECRYNVHSGTDVYPHRRHWAPREITPHGLRGGHDG